MATYKKLPITELLVDDRYQRPLDQARVGRIVKKFDPAQFGVLEVSDRGGTYAVFDGQHRLVAARKLGMERVPCLVHTNVSPEREAELFVAHQAGRKGVTSVERFKARVFAGDPVANEVYEAVAASPFYIDGHARDGWSIRSVTALERVYHMGLLPQVLDTIADLWGGDDRATDPGLIEGMALLIEGYDNRLDGRALRRLRATPPIDIVRRSLGRMSYASSKSSDRRMAVLAELRKISGVRGRPSSRREVVAV